jgi:hypothetical protein
MGPMTTFLHAQSRATLPADFDPFFAVMGVKCRDWAKPQPAQQPKLPSQNGEKTC